MFIGIEEEPLANTRSRLLMFSCCQKLKSKHFSIPKRIKHRANSFFNNRTQKENGRRDFV
jgi:hypothetical protein